MQLNSSVIFASLIVLSTAYTRCGDVTTRRAIEKRERQINLKCIENKEKLEKCSNRTAVDVAWKHFEEINDNYMQILDNCKKSERQRRSRYHDYDNDDNHRHRHRHRHYHCHHHHEYYLSGQSVEKVPRHVHGTSDDKYDADEKDLQDYSKDFVRPKRYTCLEDARREKARLLEKFATLCDTHVVCDRDKMTKSAKDNLNSLSKERQKAYSEYVTSFQLCYGPVD